LLFDFTFDGVARLSLLLRLRVWLVVLSEDIWGGDVSFSGEDVEGGVGQEHDGDERQHLDFLLLLVVVVVVVVVNVIVVVGIRFWLAEIFLQGSKSTVGRQCR
jgi:hypothetical protein